ncbi:uncharacterized protein LOC141598245 [Silene latifolia]|uniref:uncharacterized protein LOC141598245 n=1 Tax=Silene latifolia TaxID=37657 RepID=UPI003D7757FB
MNVDVEKIGLLDISIEDDLLIDKHLDNSSLDLRLSAAFETQMELVFDLKPREYSDSVRSSLAWDNAFFTSPGFLELEELCLVNRGFKDPQHHLVHGNLQSVRRKVCLERDSGHKMRVTSRRSQNATVLTKAKIASPTKVLAKQDKQHQQVTTRRPEAFSGATSKSQVMQSIISKKECLKSGKATGQFRSSAAHKRTPPLQGVNGNGKTRTPERLGSMVSRETNSRTSLPLLPSSMNLSPCRSIDYAGRTVNMTKSQDIKGGQYHSPINRMPHSQQSRQPCIKQGTSGRGLQRQNATRATKSPLSSNSKLSPKPSMLPLPSENFDYFDVKSGALTVDASSLLYPKGRSNCEENIAPHASESVHTPASEPKHKSNGAKLKGTPPILQERNADTRNYVDINLEGQRRRNHPFIMKTRDTFGKADKENMFSFEVDTVIEVEPKQHPPLCGSSVTNISTGSSSKYLAAAQMTKRETNSSPIGTRKDFSTRISAVQKSSFF